MSFLIENNLDILIIAAKMKLDSSFPESQFVLEEIRKPYRLGVSTKKDDLLVFVNKDFLSKCLQSFHLPEDTQAISSLKQRKLLVMTICRPPDQILDCFLSLITVVLNRYL